MPNLNTEHQVLHFGRNKISELTFKIPDNHDLDTLGARRIAFSLTFIT